jgi:membrane-associated phospholipid phosphatase
MWARFVSVVTHPLLMPTYLFALLSWALPASLEPIKPELHLKFLFFIFIVTFLLPLLNVAIFKTFGTVRTFAMTERKERLIPFIFITAIYVIVTYLFHSQTQMNLNDNFLKFMIVIDLLVIVATAATFVFKVSVHCISAWGFIGIIVPLNKISEINTLFYPMIISILLAGIIMSARLYAGAHTSREVMWGGVLGLGTGVVGMLILF